MGIYLHILKPNLQMIFTKNLDKIPQRKSYPLHEYVIYANAHKQISKCPKILHICGINIHFSQYSLSVQNDKEITFSN